jgi:hypothetical protein
MLNVAAREQGAGKEVGHLPSFRHCTFCTPTGRWLGSKYRGTARCAIQTMDGVGSPVVGGDAEAGDLRGLARRELLASLGRDVDLVDEVFDTLGHGLGLVAELETCGGAALLARVPAHRGRRRRNRAVPRAGDHTGLRVSAVAGIVQPAGAALVRVVREARAGRVVLCVALAAAVVNACRLCGLNIVAGAQDDVLFKSTSR